MPTDPAPSPAISETDMMIFRRLCNPQKVDLSGEPADAAPSLSPLPPTQRRAPGTSTFAKALNTPAMPAPAPAPKSRRSAAAPPPPPSYREEKPAPAAAPPTPPSYAAPLPEDPSVETHRRHANLLHLQKMEQMGMKLTRKFTMDDPSEVTQFEIDFQENNQAVTSAVGMMKGGIGFGFLGLELANAKFGPFLNLTGLSATACQDMNRYNQPLERLYRRFFRKKAMSPIAELLMLIFGTILMTHFGNKGGPMIKMLLSTFMGGKQQSQPTTAAPEAQFFSQRGFDPRNLPATPAPVAPPPPVPATPLSEPRKTMRRPGSVRETSAAQPPPPPPPPPVPPAPRFAGTTVPPTMIFPVAGTPLRGMRASQEPPIMALPTVIEEVSEEPVAPSSSDLDRDTFERLMKEVTNQDET